ncbi:MAG: DinB family protein [Bacteroidia bacterium]
MKSELLLAELREMTLSNISRCEKFQSLSDNELNYKSSSESWSVLECIDHLNRYGNFYIPEISSSIKSSKHGAESNFKSGVLGNYFASSMLPKEDLNKMKTFKSMNPIGSSLNNTVLKTFIEHQNKILDLLNESRNVSLTTNKTAISISKWIRLRLGDTLRVVIYHNLRHIEQAERASKIARGLS